MLMLPKKLQLALNLATQVFPKLPVRGDGPIQVVVKLLAVADSCSTVLRPGKTNALEDLIRKFDLKSTKSQQFVALFFDTKLHEEFEITRYSIAEYLDIIDASSPEYGRIFFTEYNYGAQREPEETFFHTKDFNFTEILKGLWESYDGRLHVTLRPGRYGVGTASEFATFTAPPNPLYGAMKKRMEDLIARHRRWKLDDIPRAYMFYGPPGTGKTSFAMEFAERLGERILKVDAVSLSHCRVRDIAFLLDGLQPDFFLVDDVDKADVGKTIPTVLELLSRFKTDHTKTTAILTANTVDQFDPGFLRPNRIDTWEEFALPAVEERREILEQYIREQKATVDADTLAHIVTETESLSQDYLREVASQFKYEESEEILLKIKLMRKLKDENRKKAKAGEVLVKEAAPSEEKSVYLEE